MTEREVLSAYSTPGLKRNQLPRAAKKDHLLQLRVPGEKIEEILDRLYGPQAVPLAVIDDQPEQSTGTMVRLENGWCSECERRTYGRKPLVRGSTTKRIPIKWCAGCGRTWDFKTGDQIGANRLEAWPGKFTWDGISPGCLNASLTSPLSLVSDEFCLRAAAAKASTCIITISKRTSASVSIPTIASVRCSSTLTRPAPTWTPFSRIGRPRCRLRFSTAPRSPPSVTPSLARRATSRAQSSAPSSTS